MSRYIFYVPCSPCQIGYFTIFNIKMGVYLEKYGDSIMHRFFKTLFRFLVFSKGLYYLLNDNSILNSHTIRARVNNLSLILKIAKLLTQCNKQGSRLACKAIRRKLTHRTLSNFAYMLQIYWICNRTTRLMQFSKYCYWLRVHNTKYS